MTSSDLTFQTSALKSDADYLAPDGSEIRLLPTMKGGGLCHCTLPVGKTSYPVAHQNVEEIWYVIEGEGEVWRKAAGAEETVRVSAGTSLTIPPTSHSSFAIPVQARCASSSSPMPPWPGPQEAVDAVGVWPAMPRFDAGVEHPSDMI